jgi:RNA polymerase sigma-70 factor (family 1)
MLMTRIAGGDEKAFHPLYQRYFGKVYAMALKYLPNVFQAQDIVQEVFGRVWLNRAQLPTIQSFEAWLITITRNLLINELRKMHPAGSQPVAPADPHAILEYRQLEQLLLQAVNKLSNRQREVYRLSRVEGYSHKEIAAQLGISVDVSREHLSKALHNIRAFLLQEYGLLGLMAATAFAL